MTGKPLTGGRNSIDLGVIQPMKVLWDSAEESHLISGLFRAGKIGLTKNIRALTSSEFWMHPYP